MEKKNYKSWFWRKFELDKILTDSNPRQQNHAKFLYSN